MSLKKKYQEIKKQQEEQRKIQLDQQEKKAKNALRNFIARYGQLVKDCDEDGINIEIGFDIEHPKNFPVKFFLPAGSSGITIKSATIHIDESGNVVYFYRSVVKEDELNLEGNDDVKMKILIEYIGGELGL